MKTRWLNAENDLEITPPPNLDLGGIDADAARRTRSIIMFLGPLMHRIERLRAALRRRLRPRHPHRRAAHDRAATLRPAGEGDRGQLPRDGPAGHRPDAPDRAHRARRHRHRERPDGRGAVRQHHGDPQRQLQLHGPGPVLLPGEARRADRGHRHHHPGGHRLHRHRRGRRLRAQRGPDRGDVAARRGDRHRLRDHREAGADRVPRDRARRARGDGLPLLAVRGVPRRQRAHPAGRRHHACTRSCAPPSTRSTRCRSRA